MSTRLIIIILLILGRAEIKAQRRLVVIDIETMKPITEVNITTESGIWHSDSLGYITIPESSKTLIFSHVNYEERLVNLSELRDTVFLISKLLNLKEVIVFGKDKQQHDYRKLNEKMQPNTKELQMVAAGKNMNGGLNLLGLINYLFPSEKRLSKKEKKKKKLKEILDKY